MVARKYVDSPQPAPWDDNQLISNELQLLFRSEKFPIHQELFLIHAFEVSYPKRPISQRYPNSPSIIWVIDERLESVSQTNVVLVGHQLTCNS